MITRIEMSGNRLVSIVGRNCNDSRKRYSNDSRKRQEMRLISKLGTVHPLGISVTCLCLTCSDIARSNPTFVFIVLLAPCMLSHITPIFNPVYKI